MEHTVEQMQQVFGVTPETVLAAIGPGIGGCCFEVGEEVAAVFPDFVVGITERGKPKVDLTNAARQRLIAQGIPAHQISAQYECTACLPERYFSHRRDHGQTGRMAGIIGIRENDVARRELNLR
jgi:hypothetical protein